MCSCSDGPYGCSVHPLDSEKNTGRRSGVVLGVYQAHALGSPVAAALMWLTEHNFMALLFIVGATIGWAGWKRDFDLRWRP